MQFPRPALLRRPRRAGDSRAAAPDAAREEADRPVPVADVRAADSVSVRPAAEDSALAAADGAAGGAGADHPGVRAAVLRSGETSPAGRAPARAKWSSCSTPATAWASAIAGTRAAAAARAEFDKLSASDRGSVVLFASGADIELRSTAERDRLAAAVATAKPGSGATRLCAGAEGRRQHPGRIDAAAARGGADQRLPAQRLARRRRRAAAAGRDADADRRSRAPPIAPNLSVTGVSLARSTFSNQERVTVTAGVTNRTERPVSGSTIALEVDGLPRREQAAAASSRRRRVGRPSSRSPSARSNLRGTVRLADDALAADNAFNFVVSPSEPVRVTIVDRGNARCRSVSRARAGGRRGAEVRERSRARRTR